MFAACCESLTTQTSDDWTHTVLHDDEGRGVPWANRNLADYADKLVGQYVWILDDDDVCTYDYLVEQLRDFTRRDVIMLRGDYGPRHPVLPEFELWGKPPLCAHIGMSCFIVRREVFQAHANAFRVDRMADCRFIQSVFDSRRWAVGWWNVVAMKTQDGAHFGAGENE